MNKYTEMLLDLLPSGLAWTKSRGSNLRKLIEGIAVEFNRFETRINDVVSEADPRTTTEGLTDWERVAGLPDECAADDQTALERRANLLQRITSRGGMSKAYFEQVISDLGFKANVRDNRPFQAGRSTAGDALYNHDDWRFAWTVELLEAVIYQFRAGSGRAGEPLRVFRNEQVECLLNELKPAHTIVVFSFITEE